MSPHALFACCACCAPLRLFVSRPLGLPGLHGYCGSCALLLVQLCEPPRSTTTDTKADPVATGAQGPTGRQP